jgi:uncharacterized protein (DUF2267 family)
VRSKQLEKENAMSATGLPVFDKTIQTTNLWLDEIIERLGPDRQHAWKVLSTVLHKVRDRLPLGEAVHLGAQLPLIVRGVYYDQFTPSRQPTDWDLERFVAEVNAWLADTRPTDPTDAIRAVFRTLSRNITPGEIENIQNALPADLRAFWKAAEEAIVPPLDGTSGRIDSGPQS